MNKMVEIAKSELKQNGFDPEMLNRTIEYAKSLEVIGEKVEKVCEIIEVKNRYIDSIQKEKNNLEEEVNNLREAGLRLVVTDIEFLDKFVNIDINCKEDLKKLQNVAGKRLISLKDIELYSR